MNHVSSYLNQRNNNNYAQIHQRKAQNRSVTMEPVRKEIIIVYDPTKGVPATSKDLREARKDVEARLDEIGARMDESTAALKQLK
ncbi:hypothetical protein NA56DRAFT_703893 [Hyaloscypha hepaticicola]|uniref:Uncharacterized protein n=1 Tax=Hyaloscypha hepaticicola TaxID=2082293 RepID=A0A2J6Q4H5_9HELO|nr:hypothetical protein NA56DRAFT_703893 [Hyaloscypha hepaticicola]